MDRGEVLQPTDITNEVLLKAILRKAISIDQVFLRKGIGSDCYRRHQKKMIALIDAAISTIRCLSCLQKEVAQLVT